MTKRDTTSSYHLVLNDGESVSSLDTNSILSLSSYNTSFHTRGGSNHSMSLSGNNNSFSRQALGSWGMGEPMNERRDAFGGFRNHHREAVQREARRQNSPPPPPRRKPTRTTMAGARDRWRTDAPGESSTNRQIHAGLKPRLPQRQLSEGTTAVKRRNRVALQRCEVIHDDDDDDDDSCHSSSSSSSSSSSDSELDDELVGFLRDHMFETAHKGTSALKGPPVRRSSVENTDDMDVLIKKWVDHGMNSSILSAPKEPKRRSSVEDADIDVAIEWMDQGSSTSLNSSVIMGPPRAMGPPPARLDSSGKDDPGSSLSFDTSSHSFMPEDIESPRIKTNKPATIEETSSSRARFPKNHRRSGTHSTQQVILPQNTARFSSAERPRQPKPNRQRRTNRRFKKKSENPSRKNPI